MVGIIDDGSEEVEGLDEGGLVIETIDPSIVAGLGPYKEAIVFG